MKKETNKKKRVRSRADLRLKEDEAVLVMQLQELLGMTQKQVFIKGVRLLKENTESYRAACA